MILCSIVCDRFFNVYIYCECWEKPRTAARRRDILRYFGKFNTIGINSIEKSESGYTSQQKLVVGP